MLVLSRKLGESIVINNDIVITVVRIRDDKVRIGVQADSLIPVHRSEVQQRLDAQAAAAAAAAQSEGV